MTIAAKGSIEDAPQGYPLIGHLPQFLRDKLGFLSRCANTQADVVRLRLDGDAFLLLDDRDIKHVLESNYPNYDKSPKMVSRRGKQLSGYGLLTASGKEHIEKRKAVQPVFAASSITPLADGIVRETESILETWTANREFDAATEMMDLSQCINGRILFGADYRREDAELGEAIRIRRRFMHDVFNALLPFPEYLPTAARSAFKKAQQLIDADVKARITLRRASPEKHPDMLARMTAALDDSAAREEAVTTAITGYETIGEAMAWTLFLLAQHPQVEKKLVDEVKSVLKGNSPAADDLPKLRYTEMVLNESMRLYPPTWIYVRMAKERDRLSSGVDLPAGAKLYICPWVIHRSQRYFDDPLQFNPLRFDDQARKGRPKYAYFPFGGGPRVCIGQALAKMQMPLMLAMIVQRFSLELIPGQTIVPDPKITLSPSPGIQMIARRR